VPVLVDGGTWDVTFPAFCHLTLDCHYLPAHWHPDLGAGPVKAEIRERIDAAAAADPWLADTRSPGSGSGRCHPPRSPPTIRW